MTRSGGYHSLVQSRRYLLDRGLWRDHPIVVGLFVLASALMVGALVLALTGGPRQLGWPLLCAGFVVLIAHQVAVDRVLVRRAVSRPGSGR